MKHTPGPWKARDYKNSDGDIWIDCAAYKGETPLGGTLAIALHTGRGKGEMNDNARLIAAAPELLAACEAAEQCIADFLDVYTRGCSMQVLDLAVRDLKVDALRRIKAALEKATA